ncbi:carbohydrate ABC transporter permease [Micromonospora sp. NPDC051300]|uniref:carbohydrate ABC transporter permease n=1 Tax=Micromonospora sp. NPDC051300 TaxID=3364286 RepID=UPI0037931E98
MALFPQVGQKAPGARIGRGGVHLLLWSGVVLHLIPFYFLLVTSVKPAEEAQAEPPTLWPRDWDFSAWRIVWDLATSLDGVPAELRFIQEPFWVYFKNSIFIAVVTLALSLPVTSLAAYANSKMQRGRGARASFLFFISTLMIPFIVVMVPTFLLTKNFPFALPQAPEMPNGEPVPTLTLWDTPWAVILPAVFVPFSFLLFKGFFDTIPDSVIQAARVDGGSEFNIFRRIVLPMSVPVYAVAAYTSFASVWDNFIWQLLVLQTPDKATTSVTIYSLVNALQQQGAGAQAGAAQSARLSQLAAAGVSWNGLMVLSLLQTLPIFVTFVVCRRYLLRGIRIRGLK